MIPRTYALALLFTLTTWFNAALAADYPPSEVEMELTQVSPHVYYVLGKAGIATDNEGFISNSVAIIGDESIVIVDALSSPSLAEKMVSLVREVSDLPITKVIVTHYHADHIYGLRLYQEMGAEIIAPSGYREYFDSQVAKDRLAERRQSLAPWVNEDTRLVAADRVIEADTELQVGNLDLALTHLGAAHSDADLMVLVKNDNVLISGDLIFEGRVPFTGSADTGHWLAMLERLEGMELTALIPGHGPAARNPDQTIALTLRYLRQVREVMAAAVEDFVPFAEAYEAADWSEFEELPAFDATHRRNAFGVYLSLEREMME